MSSITVSGAPPPRALQRLSTSETIKTEDQRSTSSCEGYDVTKMQCTKMLYVIDEATKNDAAFIPSKLLDFIVSTTFDADSMWVMGGCTEQETCDWIVHTLQERMSLGQYWVSLKVYTIIHELLWRGSNVFVRSMERKGMAMLQYNEVVAKIRATTQENVSGAPLPCTLSTSEPHNARGKAAHTTSAATEAKKKTCGTSLFSCNRNKPETTSKTHQDASATCTNLVCTGSDKLLPGQVNACSPLLVHASHKDQKGTNVNTGFVDLCQQQQDFLWSMTAYLEAFCLYRSRHPSVDLVRSRLQVSPDSTMVTMKSLKVLLDDTLELLKSTATGDPHVPVGCVLAMSVVRKRMNDARVLYNIACHTLLRMLERLFLQASHCMKIWNERYGLSGGPSFSADSVSREKTDELLPDHSISAQSSITNDSCTIHDVSEEGLRDKMVELFAQWYHAIFQFDRTVDMLQSYCDEVEKNSGETYLVASHLHRIPHTALHVIRDLLKMVKEKGTCKPCRALSECDLTSPISPNARCTGGSGSSTLGKSASGASLESATSDLTDDTEAHLKEIRHTWGLQLSALRRLFEMEGETPPTLDMLQADLDHFINAKKELLSSQTRQSLSGTVNGLSDSNYQKSSTIGSPIALRTPMSVLEEPNTSGAGQPHPQKEQPKPRAGHSSAHGCAAGISTDDESDSHHTKSLSRGTTTDGSLVDLRNTGTFILRRRLGQPSAGQQRPGLPLATKDNNSFSLVTADASIATRRKQEAVEDDMEVIPLTEDMQRTDESIQDLLQADDVVVVCNEPFSSNDHMKLAERFQVISGLPPLGEGTYGRVFRAWDDLVGRYLAAKEMPLDESKKRASAVREVLKEYMVLTELNHPNIVRVLAFMVVGKMGRIFMEWMPSGSLQDVLRFSPRGVLRESVVSRYADDALHGLAYLHGRGVLHRDVKPGNMLLGSDGTVKLTDFGTSSVLAAGKHTLESAAIMGTAPYMAPEAVQGLYSTASDIWSFGCAVLELVTGHVPWSDPVTGNKMDAVPLLFKIGSLSDTDSATANERPNSHLLPESRADEVDENKGNVVVSDDLADFLKRIFVANRRNRPTAEELMEHPFITTHRNAWEQRKQAHKA